MRDLHLLVGGMGCRHCVREVTARLRDVPGVERVVADASTNRVRLTGSMSRTDVLAALCPTPPSSLVSSQTGLPGAPASLIPAPTPRATERGQRLDSGTR